MDTGAITGNGAKSQVEWPTLLLISVFYALFAALTLNWHALPWWLAWPAAAYLAGLYGSIQHEVIHGHPSRWRWLNEVFVFPGLLIWVPYGRYRDQHLRHHSNELLTDPYEDPESYYLAPEQWSRVAAPARMVLRFNNTLAGRLIIGPAISMLRFWWQEARIVLGGDRRAVAAWAVHAAGVSAAIYWMYGVCAIPPASIFFAFAYAGTSLILLRSFAEHRAHERPTGRTAIVETCPALAFLFLNNNLHALHHEAPGLPWYRLPSAYRDLREELLKGNDGYLIGGYLSLARRYLFAAKEPVAHPLRGSPAGPR